MLKYATMYVTLQRILNTNVNKRDIDVTGLHQTVNENRLS